MYVPDARVHRSSELQVSMHDTSDLGWDGGPRKSCTLDYWRGRRLSGSAIEVVEWRWTSSCMQLNAEG